jgi:hypothetical protein
MNAPWAAVTPQQQAEMKQIENLKRQGHKFIRVLWRGRQTNPTLHGYKTVEAYERYDDAMGKLMWDTKIGCRGIKFGDLGTGELAADIYDCEENRYALSRLVDFVTGDPPRAQIEIEDKDTERELRSIANKPYVVEPDRKTLLMRKRAELDAEIAAIQGNEPIPTQAARKEATLLTPPAFVAPIHRRRPGRPRFVSAPAEQPAADAETTTETGESDGNDQ